MTVDRTTVPDGTITGAYEAEDTSAVMCPRGRGPVAAWSGFRELAIAQAVVKGVRNSGVRWDGMMALREQLTTRLDVIRVVPCVDAVTIIYTEMRVGVSTR